MFEIEKGGGRFAVGSTSCFPPVMVAGGNGPFLGACFWFQRQKVCDTYDLKVQLGPTQ